MKSFEEFWKQYPARNGRKCGKANAEKSFRKLNPDEELFGEMMQKLDLQKRHYAACKKARVFVPEFPDAERWIRGQRWEDEVFGIPEQPDRDPEEVRHAAHVQRTKEYIDSRKRAEQESVPMPAEVRQLRRSLGASA